MKRRTISDVAPQPSPNDAPVPLDVRKRAWGHFNTITQHKLLVTQLCFRAGLYAQGMLHDLSKYTPGEFATGVRYFTGVRSPNATERDEKGFTEAWLHHKGRNKHHFEYWVDLVLVRTPEAVRPGFFDAGLSEPGTFPRLFYASAPMPTRYVVEMFCDRVAACKVYQKERYTDASALEYYLKESCNRAIMHPDTQALLEVLLRMLAEEGEETTLRFIREAIVQPRFSQGAYARF